MLRSFTRKQCKKDMQIRAFFLAAVAVMIDASASVSTSTYVAKPVYGSGSANVAPANGGEYVYGAVRPDGRVKTRAILTGAIERNDYKFFTPDEERALLAFKNAELAKVVRAKLASERARHAKKHPRLALKWPKVVLRGSQVCVPELASSEADDWKDHLTCYDAEGKK